MSAIRWPASRQPIQAPEENSPANETDTSKIAPKNESDHSNATQLKFAPPPSIRNQILQQAKNVEEKRDESTPAWAESIASSYLDEGTASPEETTPAWAASVASSYLGEVTASASETPPGWAESVASSYLGEATASPGETTPAWAASVASSYLSEVTASPGAPTSPWAASVASSYLHTITTAPIPTNLPVPAAPTNLTSSLAPAISGGKSLGPDIGNMALGLTAFYIAQRIFNGRWR